MNDLLRQSLSARASFTSAGQTGQFADIADDQLRQSVSARASLVSQASLARDAGALDGNDGTAGGAADRSASQGPPVPARMSVSVHALAMQEPPSSNLEESPATSISARGRATPPGNAAVAAWQAAGPRHLDASRMSAANDTQGVARLSASPQHTDVRGVQAMEGPRGISLQASAMQHPDAAVARGGVDPQAPTWQAVTPPRLDAALRSASGPIPAGSSAQPADPRVAAWQAASPLRLDAGQPAFADQRVAARHTAPTQHLDSAAAQLGADPRTPRQRQTTQISSAIPDSSGNRSGAVSPNVPLRLASGVATPMRLAEGMGCHAAQPGPQHQLQGPVAWGPPGQTVPGVGMQQVSSALPAHQQQPPVNAAYTRPARMATGTQDDAQSTYSSGSSNAMAALGRPIADGRPSSMSRVRPFGSAEVARSVSPMPRAVVVPGTGQRSVPGFANFPADATSRHTLPAGYNAYSAPQGGAQGAQQRQLTQPAADGRHTLPAGANWPGMPCGVVRAQTPRGAERALGSPSAPPPWAPVPAPGMQTEPIAYAVSASPAPAAVAASTPRRTADGASGAAPLLSGACSAAETSPPDLGRETSPTRMGFKEAVHKVAARALREFKQNHRRTLAGEHLAEGQTVFSNQ